MSQDSVAEIIFLKAHLCCFLVSDGVTLVIDLRLVTMLTTVDANCKTI